MTEETKTAFEAVAEEAFERMLEMEVGSETWNNAARGAAELGKVYIDEAIEVRKLELEREKLELEKKRASLDKVKIAVEATMFLIAVAWTSYETKKGYQFEQTGTVTSGTLKHILNGMRTPKVL